MIKIGLALSGGGHRATVWALGVLLYLVDAGMNRNVGTISSVSGGSIANGVLAHSVDFAETDPEHFRTAIRPALTHVARDGLFFWGRQTNAYLVATLGSLTAGAVLVVAWPVAAAVTGATELPPAVHVAGGAGLFLLLLGSWLFSRRSVVVERALARVHFGGSPGPRLADVRRRTEHVFCATELQSGYHVYLAPAFVHSYAFGTGAPADLTLAAAVQCSACLPFAFAPRRLPAGRHHFAVPPGGPVPPRHLVLSDGGVYDNMADQWLVGLPDRVRRNAGLPIRTTRLDHQVVVNAGGTNRLRGMRAATLPFIGDLLTLRRVNDILYAGTTSHRRQQLVRAGDSAAHTGEGPLTALLQTTQTPYVVAEALAGGTDERAGRAREAVAHLARYDPYGASEWARRAAANASVPTVLRRLGTGTTVNLLEHAYLTAMYGTHVLLGYPLLTPPARESFEALVGPGERVRSGRRPSRGGPVAEREQQRP